MIVMGLDISTSVVGCTFMKDDFTLLEMTHIDFKSKMDFWQKADHAIATLRRLLVKNSADVLYIEEPVLGYSVGKSSANTIMTLAKFNYILSYALREEMGHDPIHVTVGAARKLCGLKMMQRKKCGKSHKEQTFEAMTSTTGPLAGHSFPLTKNGTYKGFVADEVDSYVIARAGVISLNSALKSPT